MEFENDRHQDKMRDIGDLDISDVMRPSDQPDDNLLDKTFETEMHLVDISADMNEAGDDQASPIGDDQASPMVPPALHDRTNKSLT